MVCSNCVWQSHAAISIESDGTRNVRTLMSPASAACELRHGIWLGGSKYEGPCSLVGRLESVCVRVRLAVDFTWALDNVDEDGAPDQGCWSRDGKMTSFIYTPLVKADTSVSLGGVSFVVRSTDDPYIKAQRLTDGSMYGLCCGEL